MSRTVVLAAAISLALAAILPMAIKAVFRQDGANVTGVGNWGVSSAQKGACDHPGGQHGHGEGSKVAGALSYPKRAHGKTREMWLENQ
mgnify:CR=1 FL=1